MGAMRQKRIDSEDKVRESEVLDRHSMGQLFLEEKVHRQHLSPRRLLSLLLFQSAFVKRTR
jgi:hypothetical protein